MAWSMAGHFRKALSSLPLSEIRSGRNLAENHSMNLRGGSVFFSSLGIKPPQKRCAGAFSRIRHTSADKFPATIGAVVPMIAADAGVKSHANHREQMPVTQCTPARIADAITGAKAPGTTVTTNRMVPAPAPRVEMPSEKAPRVEMAPMSAEVAMAPPTDFLNGVSLHDFRDLRLRLNRRRGIGRSGLKRADQKGCREERRGQDDPTFLHNVTPDFSSVPARLFSPPHCGRYHGLTSGWSRQSEIGFRL
jgi:hypothetical protein